MRDTTNKWESDFLFDVFDRTAVELLQREPRTVRYVARVIREQTESALRVWALQCGRDPNEMESQGVGT